MRDRGEILWFSGDKGNTGCAHFVFWSNGFSRFVGSVVGVLRKGLKASLQGVDVVAGVTALAVSWAVLSEGFAKA